MTEFAIETEIGTAKEKETRIDTEIETETGSEIEIEKETVMNATATETGKKGSAASGLLLLPVRVHIHLTVSDPGEPVPALAPRQPTATVTAIVHRLVRALLTVTTETGITTATALLPPKALPENATRRRVKRIGIGSGTGRGPFRISLMELQRSISRSRMERAAQLRKGVQR